MEIIVKNIKDDEDWKPDFKYSYDGYKVFVEEHRILTISTDHYITTTKWLEEVQKRHRNNKNGTIIVGVCVDRFKRGGRKDSPYDLLQLCIGSHCLIYRFPHRYCYQNHKSLRRFFANPRVVAVGMDMVSVAKKLEKDRDIKVANPMDLNSMAVMGLRRDDLDLEHYDLDRLGKVVLEKHVYVIRPEKQVEWYCKYDGHHFKRYEYDRPFTHEKVKYATFDPYLCFLIGSKLLDMMNESSASSSSSRKKKKKNKKKRNKKKKMKKKKKKMMAMTKKNKKKMMKKKKKKKKKMKKKRKMMMKKTIRNLSEFGI